MPTPNLGYGTRGEAPINSVNQWMRSQPWYQQLITSFGQNPNNVHLNDDQKQQVIRAAQANGVVVDEGHDGQQIDDSGNFEAKGHGLRNTLIVAGIAGAALLTAGAAGMFGGAALGAGEGAAGAGAGAAADAGMFGPLAAGYGAATTTAAAPAGIAATGGAAAAAGGAGAAGGGKVAATLFGVPADDIFKTGASLFGNLFGANMQISAADRSAAATAAAAKYAADLQAKASADALAFQYGSAENSFLNNEAARQGNYAQDAAHQRRLGTIGEEVGLGPREIPAYVPGVDPHFGGGGGGAAATGGGAPSAALMPANGEVNWTAPADQLGSQLTAYFKKRGVAASEVPYWVQQAGSLVQRGQQLNDPLYASRRLAAAEIFGGGGAQPAAAAPVARPYAPLTTATPFMNAVPQSIGYYA